MSEHYNNPSGYTQGSPPARSNTGVEGLMSSLISPGPTTPGQGGNQLPWIGMQDWATNMQSQLGLHLPTQVQASNQTMFQQNSEDDYAPYEPPEPQEPYSPNMNLGSGIHQSTDGAAFNRASLQSQPQPLFVKPPLASPGLSSEQRATGAPSTPGSDAGAHSKRLQELRAQLMASKKIKSRESTPVLRPKSSQTAPQHQDQGPPTIASVPKANENGIATSKAVTNGSAKSTKPSHAMSGRGFSKDLDNLLNEVRNETIEGGQGLHTAGKPESNGSSSLPKNAQSTLESRSAVMPPMRPPLPRPVVSDDLSDGEIRDDEEVQLPAQQIPTITTPALAKKDSLASEEKSRRESEVEAAYSSQSGTPRDRLDSAEKIRRQSQVDLAYSPLKRSSGSGPKPGSGPLDASSRKGSGQTQKSPKSNVEPSGRPWLTQPRARGGGIGEYDSYKPAYRKPVPIQPPSAAEPPSSLGKRTAAGDRADFERRRAVEQNERAAEAYRKAINAGARPTPSRVISHTETLYLGNATEDPMEVTKTVESRPDPDSPISPKQQTQTPSADADLSDWLELTEYYDEEYRARKLQRFRKKKELDKARLELEQEEQMEIQQRSLFRTSAHATSGTPPKAIKMAPPALPLREIGNTNHTTKAAAPAAQAEKQVATPTLKRQHAEDDTDPRNKIARVDTVNRSVRGGPPSSSTIKGETSPTFPGNGPVPLEHRISRDDGQVSYQRYRPREESRSPDYQNRRRSASPDHRRYSVPEPGFVPTCHHCGQRGHYRNQCVDLRRDGKDNRYHGGGGGGGGARGGRPPNTWVSANYQGKKPVPGFQDPRAARGRSIVDDDNKRP